MIKVKLILREKLLVNDNDNIILFPTNRIKDKQKNTKIKIYEQGKMTEKNWKKWRKRVQGRKTKHSSLRNEGVNRFKSSRQKAISGNRISKR